MTHVNPVKMEERRKWEKQKDIGEGRTGKGEIRGKRKGFKKEEEEMIEAQKSPESKAILFLPTEGQRRLFEASNAEKIYQGMKCTLTLVPRSQSLVKTALPTNHNMCRMIRWFQKKQFKLWVFNVTSNTSVVVNV